MKRKKKGIQEDLNVLLSLRHPQEFQPYCHLEWLFSLLTNYLKSKYNRNQNTIIVHGGERGREGNKAKNLPVLLSLGLFLQLPPAPTVTWSCSSSSFAQLEAPVRPPSACASFYSCSLLIYCYFYLARSLLLCFSLCFLFLPNLLAPFMDENHSFYHPQDSPIRAYFPSHQFCSFSHYTLFNP